MIRVRFCILGGGNVINNTTRPVIEVLDKTNGKLRCTSLADTCSTRRDDTLTHKWALKL